MFQDVVLSFRLILEILTLFNCSPCISVLFRLKLESRVYFCRNQNDQSIFKHYQNTRSIRNKKLTWKGQNRINLFNGVT
jgi:hypothetical protein